LVSGQVARKLFNVDKIKAEWCRRFAQLLLASGVTDIGAAVALANATYPSASTLSPEEAVWLLFGSNGGQDTHEPRRGDA
jgi:hypothetical protein